MLLLPQPYQSSGLSDASLRPLQRLFSAECLDKTHFARHCHQVRLAACVYLCDLFVGLRLYVTGSRVHNTSRCTTRHRPANGAPGEVIRVRAGKVSKVCLKCGSDFVDAKAGQCYKCLAATPPVPMPHRIGDATVCRECRASAAPLPGTWMVVRPRCGLALRGLACRRTAQLFFCVSSLRLFFCWGRRRCPPHKRCG